MDAISSHLVDMRGEVEVGEEVGWGAGGRAPGGAALSSQRPSPLLFPQVPRSVPGLVSRRVLTMGFVEGESIARGEGRGEERGG
jgi:hypothetical protein